VLPVEVAAGTIEVAVEARSQSRASMLPSFDSDSGAGRRHGSDDGHRSDRGHDLDGPARKSMTASYASTVRKA